jgi:hypothetical protein
VLRVSKIPQPEKLDVVISASARTTFDPNIELVDRFYAVLSILHQVTRHWEKTAPKGEVMKPLKMAQLWTKALDIAADRKLRVDDAFGRRLRLHRLPKDLLQLTNPRQVVTEGTRLPEDVQNWARWVASRRPK